MKEGQSILIVDLLTGDFGRDFIVYSCREAIDVSRVGVEDCVPCILSATKRRRLVFHSI